MRVKKEKIRNDTKKTKRKPKNKLKEPAYSAYQSYIKSKAFKELREKVLERDGYRCQVCGRTIEEIADSGKKISLQCHHKSYVNVGKNNEEEMNDLIILCSVCHKACHSARSNLNRFTDKSPILINLKPIDN